MGHRLTRKMCWYTDSIDNHFVADYVPGTSETLFVSPSLPLGLVLVQA